MSTRTYNELFITAEDPLGTDRPMLEEVRWTLTAEDVGADEPFVRGSVSDWGVSVWVLFDTIGGPPIYPLLRLSLRHPSLQMRLDWASHAERGVLTIRNGKASLHNQED